VSHDGELWFASHDSAAAHAGVSRFKPLDDDHTEVTLRNFGYGQGEGWVKTKAYF